MDSMEAKSINMVIAVLSVKGGTGKTLVSVNLASAADESAYVDCDVEEPNGHLFFKPEGVQETAVSVLIPELNDQRCDGCRACVDFCRFHALAFINNKPLVFDEVCHSCGGCILVCPKKALTEKEKIIGKVQKGKSDQVTTYTGILHIGEASGVPIIQRLLSKERVDENKLTIVDGPPGSACMAMESIKDADYCVLVAEPTLFGVHNLDMVYQLVKLFQKPFGVILNKCLEDENPAETFCIENHIRILGRIPFDTNLGSLYSNAKIAVREKAFYWEMFSALLDTIREEVSHETARYS